MSGLFIEGTKCSLVLKSSSLFVNINGFVASTLARLCYFNQFDHGVEAVFVYNDNETFVTDFQATIGQRKVHTEIRELMSAKETHGSCFCVQEQTENDFVISIGKIPPNALVLLEVDVLGELQTTEDGQALVFKLPQIFTPFCGEFNENGVDICSATQTYKFDLKIRTDMPWQLAGCHSPSHAIQVDADADAISAETVIITLVEDFRYDRQIKVCFYPAKPLDVYTSIEPGIGPIQELNISPKSSMSSAKPVTSIESRRDSLSNTILGKESYKDSFSTNAVSNLKSKEKYTKVLISDSVKQDPPCADFSNNTTGESKFHQRMFSDNLVADSKTNSEHILRDEYCIKEHSGELKDNVCPEDYFNNEAKPTFCLKEDQKNYLNKSATKNVNTRRRETDLPFDVLKNSSPVNLCLRENNFSPVKLQDIYTSLGLLRRDSLSKNEGDLKEDVKDLLNNRRTIHSITKDPRGTESKEDITLHNLKDSSNNSTNVNSGFGKDPDLSFVAITPAWSKEHFQIADASDGTEEKHENRIHCEAENNNTRPRPRHFLNDAIIATSFLPDLKNYPVCGEYIFMVDRSGSMNGAHICNAKESLVLFLKSLPTSSYFNVVSFGSYSRSLFPCSQRYTQDSLEKGCVYVNSIRADMGGSDLLQPLKAVLENPHKAGYARNVFVLTDGDVSHPDAILRYLKIKCHKARIFTFGIGPKISYDTVCSIARNARGKAYFPTPGSKIQTKVVQCLKEVLKPTLCEIKVEWQLATNWQVIRASPEIPISVSGQRINLYASVRLPSRARKQSTPRLGEKRKTSSVKEFWFDEELDSCQLGDNMFFEDFQDDGEFSGYWGTDISTSCSDCEHEEYGIESGRNDFVRDKELAAEEIEDGDIEEQNLMHEESSPKLENEISKGIASDTVGLKSKYEDIVKTWRQVRNVRLYSSDTSTETEDECHTNCVNQSNSSEIHYKNHVDLQKGGMSQPEKYSSSRNYDFNHNHYLIKSVTTCGGMETSDDVINTLAHVTDMNTDDGMIRNNVLRRKAVDSRHFSCNASDNDVIHDVMYNDVIRNDVIHNDVVHDDVNSMYITEDGKQPNQITHNEVDSDSSRTYNALNKNIDMNSNANFTNTSKRSKENAIDCDNSDDFQCSNYQNTVLDDMTDVAETKEFSKPQDFHSCSASVLITGYIGPDIHRERIPLCLKSNLSANNGISLHQIAARKFIDGMESTMNSTHNKSEVEREIVELSKESRVYSKMTSSVTVDDTRNVIGVFQDFLDSTIRRRQQLSRNSPKPTKKEDYPPAILVSCPSVDDESRSPTKRRLGVSTEVDPFSDDDDGKYYRIERQDPEGCDQAKQSSETSLRHLRKKLVDCRNIPVKAIHRRKLVSTRLTLLTRKMRNAHKLNVFAGPPFIRLILLQSAEGYWQLTYAFARIIGLPLVQLELAAPFVDSTMIPLAEQDDKLGIDCYYDSLALWATTLALVYLRRKWASHKDNWELIATKAEAWLQRQTFPQGFGYIDVMLAAKQAIVLLEQKYRSRAKSEPAGLI